MTQVVIIGAIRFVIGAELASVVLKRHLDGS